MKTLGFAEGLECWARRIERTGQEELLREFQLGVIKTIVKNLPVVLANPTDAEVREPSGDSCRGERNGNGRRVGKRRGTA